MEDSKTVENENFTHISKSDLIHNFSPNFSLFNDKTVIAIGGGKGGVGKSFISANIAINLAKAGNKVIAIDLDLGGANLHSCLGVGLPTKTLSDYFNNNLIDINELIHQTKIENLSLISGAQDEIGMANLRSKSKNSLINQLKKISADYLILDLGAGTSANTIDFFISADHGVLVSLPEPTSIENTYRFIKSCFFRKLRMLDDSFITSEIIAKASKSKLQDSSSTPIEVLNKILELRPSIKTKVKSAFEMFSLNLILNQARSLQEEELGFAIEKICSKYFGYNLSYLGFINYDPAVWQSVRQQKSLLINFPNSESASQIKYITRKILERDQ